MSTPEYDKAYKDTISTIGRRSVDLVLEISRLEDKVRGEPLPQEDTTEDDINQNPRRRVRLR